MDSTGAKLKKIRLQKGLSLDEVQKGTKIHLNILQSIEDDSFVNVNPIYIKGFIKIYCKFLNIDFKEFLPDYKESPRSIYLPEEKPRAKPAETSKKEAAKVKLPSAKASSRLKQILAIILIIAFAGILFISIRGLVGVISQSFRRPHKASVKAPRKPQPAKARGGFNIIPLPKSKNTQTDNQKVTAGSGIRLGMRIKEDCFVELRIDGKLILKNILKKDTFESWQAKEKVELSLGNAGGVSLEVNGEALPSLGKRGLVLKNIVITKEGLKIPR